MGTPIFLQIPDPSVGKKGQENMFSTKRKFLTYSHRTNVDGSNSAPIDPWPKNLYTYIYIECAINQIQDRAPDE